MAELLPASRNSSQDYFEHDDPEFLDTLLHMELPGDVHSSNSEENGDVDHPEGTQRTLKHSRSPTPPSVESDTYGASRFGGFGEYMQRKRAKLQIQNTQMGTDGDSSGIFRGLAIYVNGWTEPSVQDLRQLILQHGGVFHAYLDKKGLVTHIITCSLTPAKTREFKHMKVVRPEWLLESARAGKLLSWQDFIFRPGYRAEGAQGTKTAQTSLDVLKSLTPQPSTTNASHNAASSGVTETKGHAGTSEVEIEECAEGQDSPISKISHHPEANDRTPQVFSPGKRPSAPLSLYTTDPVTTEQARVPKYAAHASNPNAKRAMADPEWRSAHTSAAPDFIEGYYKNSRLHHLSTWKAELKGLVSEAQERAENNLASGKPQFSSGSKKSGGEVALESAQRLPELQTANTVSMRGAELVMRSPKGKGKAKPDDERVIMHCDFDCFFVSAGLVGRPHLRGKPVVVCHSQGTQGGSSSTSEIASSSYEARKFGVKNGMSLQQARKLCPTIMTIPYEFERYKQFSLRFYTILMSHADDLQAVSVDEALIDVTSGVEKLRAEAALRASEGSSDDFAKDLAETIRDQVKKATDCEVSIGIAHNILLARIATRSAKPAGSYHLLPADVQRVLAPLDLADLHGFGWSTRQKALEKLGMTSLGELANKSKSVLCDALGKGTGETLYKAVRGIDDRKLESDKPRKSVSCEISYGIRFENNEQAEAFVYQMAEEVARRLNDVRMRGRSMTLKIMKRDPAAPVEAAKFLGHGMCENFNKQMSLAGPGGCATGDSKTIGEHAWGMLKSFDFDPKELRGIGIQVQKLESASGTINPGQAQLPFKSIESPGKAKPISASNARGNCEDDFQILVHPPSLPTEPADTTAIHQIPGPSKRSDNLELPSFSQVDKDVFDALPEDVRKELEAEYKRRSISPAPALIPEPLPAKPKSRLTVKGTNVKRITQQLAPRNRPVMTSPEKNSLFIKQEGPSTVHVSDAELRKLDIDPEVFGILPVELQREQLALARQAKTAGVSPLKLGERKVIKPYNRRARSSSAPYQRRPPPRVNHPKPSFLKQQSKEKGKKLYFTEAADVQLVIETWVEGFKECAPNARDVDYFAKFLVENVDSSRSTDAGLEKAVRVVKWWLVLLRKYWGVWERIEDGIAHEEQADGEGRASSEIVGKAWWKAFRDVKEKMDIAARKKFGGCLSLK